MHFKAFLPFLIAGLTLVACRPIADSGDIDGEVFIVVRAGNSIKLGLVEVGLYKSAETAGVVQQAKLTAGETLAAAEKRNGEAEGEFREAGFAQQAAELRYKNAASTLAPDSVFDNAKKLELFALSAKGAEFDAVLKSPGSDAEKVAELRKLLPLLEKRIEEATLGASRAAANSVNAQEEFDAAQSMQGVVKTLPPALQTSVTNADGKFRFTGLPPGEYLVAAIASREAGDKPERYAWCVPVEVRPSGAASVMLSNHNLLAAGQ
jgi:hypothetical protein